MPLFTQICRLAAASGWILLLCPFVPAIGDTLPSRTQVALTYVNQQLLRP